MSDDEREFSTLHVESYRDYETHMKPYVKLMQFQMQSDGIDVTTEDCWTYLSWCSQQLHSNLMNNIPDQMKQAVALLAQVISTTCSKQHRAYRTGKFGPPAEYEMHWPTPEAYYQARDAAIGPLVTKAPKVSNGKTDETVAEYRGGTYL